MINSLFVRYLVDVMNITYIYIYFLLSRVNLHELARSNDVARLKKELQANPGRVDEIDGVGEIFG